MVRLPVVGSDPNTWGTVLNGYLNGVLPYVVTDSQWGGGADPTGVIAANTAIQAALNTCQSGGGGVVVVPDPGQYVLGAPPLRVPSNTWLQCGDATITLLTGSLCNAIQNWAVQANRRVIDGVTTAASTTFTSATAAFTSADTGSKFRVYYQDGTWLDTTITYVSATTVTMGASAASSGTGLYAVIGAGRDSNIRVTGGIWVRQNPNGSDFNSHDMRFRHCDGLEVGQVSGYSLPGSSKFFISLGDCTVFNVHDITLTQTSSDTVHVQGPSSAGYIARISNSSPGDDVTAFTCNDYPGYNDTAGNITDITVDGVRVPVIPSTGPTACKILAGSSSTGNGYLIDRITVRDVKSYVDGSTVVVEDDIGSVNDIGGTWGRIVLDGIVNLHPTSVYPAVQVAGSTVTDLEVRAASCMNTAATNYWLRVEGVRGAQTAGLVARLLTDMDRRRVFIDAANGAQVATWLNEAQAAETPFTQPAIAYYDGSSISASITDNAVLDITGAITFELWLCPAPSQVSFWTPLAKLGQYWIEGPAANQLQFTIVHGGGNTTAFNPATLTAGQLNYVAATFVPSTSVNLYINGVAASNTTSVPATIDTSTNALLLGNRSGFSRFISGQMGDVRIWNGALSAADIAAHYADPGNLNTTTTATLAARWKCDEGAGTTFNDSSGNAHNATLSSASWNPPYTPYLVQPQLSTGVSHTVDDVITALQKIGLVHQ